MSKNHFLEKAEQLFTSGAYEKLLDYIENNREQIGIDNTELLLRIITWLDTIANQYEKAGLALAIRAARLMSSLLEKAYDLFGEKIEKALALSYAQVARLAHRGGNNYDAKRFYKKLIGKFSRSSSVEIMKILAEAYFELGNIFNDENKSYDALKNYKKVVRLYEDENLELPSLWMATVYNNLAIVSKTEYYFTDAVKYFKKALKIYKELENQHPGDFLPYLAMTYNLMGNTYVEKFDVRDEIDTFGVSGFSGFGILSADRIRSPERMIQRLNKDEGVRFYLKALEIFERLSSSKPDEYLHYVATVQHNLGIIHDELERYDQAVQWYEKAKKLREQLVRKNPGIFSADLAVTLMNLVTLYQNRFEQKGKLDDLQKSEAYFREAMKIIPRLGNELPVLESLKSEAKYYEAYFQMANEEYVDTLQAKLFKKSVESNMDETSDAHEKLKRQQPLVEKLEALHGRYPHNKELKSMLLQTYVNRIWYLLKVGLIAEAGKLIKIYDNFQPQGSRELEINRAHWEWIRGNEQHARKLYARLIEQDEKTSHEVLQTIKNDLYILASQGIVTDPSGLIKQLEQSYEAIKNINKI